MLAVSPTHEYTCGLTRATGGTNLDASFALQKFCKRCVASGIDFFAANDTGGGQRVDKHLRRSRCRDDELLDLRGYLTG